MTREEALKWFEKNMRHVTMPGAHAAHEAAIAALRGPTREMVERMRGEWVEEPYSTKSERARIIHSKKCICSVCNKSNGRKKENFCPACGAPMTDEAVDMMLRRWKEAMDGEKP